VSDARSSATMAAMSAGVAGRMGKAQLGCGVPHYGFLWKISASVRRI
jgi:hypothetical protein